MNKRSIYHRSIVENFLRAGHTHPYNNVAPLSRVLHRRLRRNARILRKDDRARVDQLDRPLERGGDERDALSFLGLGGIVRRFWSRCQLLPFFFLLFVSPRALVLAPGSPLSSVILVRASRFEPKLIKRGRSAPHVGKPHSPSPLSPPYPLLAHRHAFPRSKY